jgi:hypothetical protein
LKRLYEEDAFDCRFQGKIPTDEVFDSMSVVFEPLKIIKRASYKIQSDIKTTVQHALNLILELGYLSTLEAAT